MISSLSLIIIFVFFYLNLVWEAGASPIDGSKTKNSPPAFFVFGDSLVDNGNNNFMITSARADSPPYGIDYLSHRPTGRFCNGRTMPDLIDSKVFFRERQDNLIFFFSGEQLGMDPLLPYLDPEMYGKNLLKGANFASAGIGILNDTGIQFVNIIRMPHQLMFFEEYQKRVAAIIGTEKTKKLINEALVMVTCGGNDFVNNYYLLRISLRSVQYKLPAFVRLLTNEYQKILMRLYTLGARKVLVTATGPLGCAPSVIALRSRKGECVTELQRAARLFNPQVTAMIGSLNKKLGSDVFISAQAHHIFYDFITKPKAFGFEVTNKACCGQGPYNGMGLCNTMSHLCPDRAKYVYWDGYHPTERANQLIVKELFNGTKYMKPMNLSTLLSIDSNKA